MQGVAWGLSDLGGTMSSCSTLMETSLGVGQGREAGARERQHGSRSILARLSGLQGGGEGRTINAEALRSAA